MAGMDSYVIVILVLCALTALGNGDDAITKARSCSDIRKFYTGKGFGLDEVPLSEISGEHLRVCPQGYTCCTSAMEESLANLSRIETEHLIKISGQIQQAIINAHYKAFGGEGVFSPLPMSAECTRAIMKMTYCPHCRGVASTKACPNYCLNVMKGCLANQADLHTEWRNLLDVLEQVLNHMEAQVNVETVILTLPARMAEAVSALRENMDALNPKVFRACGELREGGTSSAAQEEVKKGGKILVPDKVGLGNRAMLEKLVSGLRAWLNTAGQYWVTQPVKFCQEMESFSGAVDEDKCWNGMTRGRYLPEMMGDGLASQINNPEVDIDITKPHMRVRQQIMELKMMTNRVKSAINGNDVEFQDTSDDVSGSGSGLCAEENCPRGPRLILPNTDSPRVYAFPPENNKVRATGSHNLPCSTLYLLSLVTPLLWR
ncbi:LOW QUALITY PROTEIN: glypican-1-like [Osmerus eperlanus]|uniref:LOW QUALITY PROTEIN: glypican-1-like n=1 Tax=Osmerus eperlanus TaxID=29151 RepID=UPI002E141781